MTPADQQLVTEVFVNTGKAIAAYVRALRCGPSRFDAWLDRVQGLGGAEVSDAPRAPAPGELARDELRGALLFVGRAGCVACHAGPRLTDDRFHNVGLAPSTVAVAFTDSGDRGAAAAMPLLVDDPMRSSGPFSDGARVMLPATFGPELEGAFRTPTLRCLEEQPSFMHTAQMGTLEQVVAFFDRGGDRDGYPGHGELVPLDLSERERADLVAFLRTLEGPGPDAALLAPPPF